MLTTPGGTVKVCELPVKRNDAEPGSGRSD
jgi:hypothetical protein